MNKDKLKIDIECDFWEYLTQAGKPVLMYGMGNGADKILAVCGEKSIEVSDFFASDGFVRGHSFHGKRVLSYSEAREKYGKGSFIVLLSFASSLPEVLENIRKISAECEFYAPDVPVSGKGIFDLGYFRKYEGRFENAYSMLADDESKRIFRNVIYYKLTGKTEYLFDSESNTDEIFLSGNILHPSEYRVTADLGAYNGDTVRELAEYAPGLESVIALEPDRRNFSKLEGYAETEKRFSVLPFHCAAWSCSETLLFDGSGNRNANAFSGTSAPAASGARGKVTEVNAEPLDRIFESTGLERLDYIKYDVEGSEAEALCGAEGVIRRFKPEMLVSLYHRNEDMFALPEAIHNLCPEYKMYLRRFRYIPAWDLNLYCVKN